MYEKVMCAQVQDTNKKASLKGMWEIPKVILLKK